MIKFTLQLTDTSAVALFDWLEEERSNCLNTTNDKNNNLQMRKIYEVRYEATHERGKHPGPCDASCFGWFDD